MIEAKRFAVHQYGQREPIRTVGQFRVYNGHIVKNASIADNVYRLLKEVTAVSKEQSWVYGGLCLPYIMLPEMNVVTKG